MDSPNPTFHLKCHIFALLSKCPKFLFIYSYECVFIFSLWSSNSGHFKFKTSMAHINVFRGLKLNVFRRFGWKADFLFVCLFSSFIFSSLFFSHAAL